MNAHVAALRQENGALQDRMWALRAQIAANAAVEEDLRVTSSERDAMQVSYAPNGSMLQPPIPRIGYPRELQVCHHVLAGSYSTRCHAAHYLQVKLEALQLQLEDEHARSATAAAADAAALREVQHLFGPRCHWRPFSLITYVRLTAMTMPITVQCWYLAPRVHAGAGRGDRQLPPGPRPGSRPERGE